MISHTQFIFFKRFILGVFLILCAAIVKAQSYKSSYEVPMDSIFFLNGEAKAVRLIDTANYTVKFISSQENKKSKTQEVEIAKVFSVKYSNGAERILYFHDSAIGNVLTVLEAKMFMLGEREADKNYKNKWPFVIGFAVGVISPLALSNAVVLSPIAPVVTPLHIYMPRIRVNTEKIADKNHLKYDSFIMGYERTARKKNFIKSLMGAGIGLVAGVGAWAIIR